jgi:hypothetical protein
VDFYQPSTALKLVQIMCDKGLLDRDEASRPQVFRPRVAEQNTERQMVSDLLDRVSGGSARNLVLQTTVYWLRAFALPDKSNDHLCISCNDLAWQGHGSPAGLVWPCRENISDQLDFAFFEAVDQVSASAHGDGHHR